MTVHKGIHGETLDDTALRVGAEESDLVTVGAAGVVAFETPEEREWYEGRVMVEFKRVYERKKHRARVERNRETAKNRKPPTFATRNCVWCGKEFEVVGPRALFCSTSGPGNCRGAYHSDKKKPKNQKEV